MRSGRSPVRVFAGFLQRKWDLPALTSDSTAGTYWANYLINANATGGPTGSAFNGLLAVTGTLTRSVGSDTPLDAISKSFIDLRVGPAYAEPDMVIMHPSTWGALRRIKDANGRYVLSNDLGALGLSADGSPMLNRPSDEVNSHSVIAQGSGQSYGNIWGIPVVCTTQLSAGQAIVASIQAGAGYWWTRLGLLVEFDPYSGASGNNFSSGLYTWRAIERVALSVPRSTALNVVTGLPVS